MENLEQRFNKNMEAWREHCAKIPAYSDWAEFINCEGYRNLVAMGKEILPLLKKAYYSESGGSHLILIDIVGDIVGSDFQIPRWTMHSMGLMQRYTIRWLDQNADNYVKEKK